MTTSKTNKNPFENVRWLNEENNLAARATCTYVHFTVSITSPNSYVEKKTNKPNLDFSRQCKRLVTEDL